MKFISLLLLVVSSSVFAQTPAIDLVKNGIMEFDKSATIGNMLDTWSICEETDWTEEQTPRNQALVMYACKIDYQQLVQIWINDLENDQDPRVRLRNYIDPSYSFETTNIREEVVISQLQGINEGGVYINFLINLDNTFEVSNSGFIANNNIAGIPIEETDENGEDLYYFFGSYDYFKERQFSYNGQLLDNSPYREYPNLIYWAYDNANFNNEFEIVYSAIYFELIPFLEGELPFERVFQ